MRADAVGTWLKISFSFLIAFMLTLLPLARPWVWLQPAWVLLVMMYWIFAAPQRMGLIWVLIIGFYLDLLTETPLGQHAIPLLMVAYLLFKFHVRLLIFPFMRQYVMIIALILLYYGIEYWLISLNLHARVWTLAAVVPVITTSLMWLLVSRLIGNHVLRAHTVRF